MRSASNQLGQGIAKGFYTLPRDYIYTPSPAPTPAYTPPAVRTPVYTPPAVRTPVYTPPVARTPAVRTPVYTAPVPRTPVPRTPTYTPTVTPDPVPRGYTTQSSYKTLARHVLEISLKANAGRLAALGIRNPLSRPYPPVKLLYTVYDAIKRYAVMTLSSRSTPFGYQSVDGRKFYVTSSSVRSSAISYMSKAMRAWGYERSSISTVTPTRTPVYTPPVERDYAYTTPAVRTPVYTPRALPSPADTLPAVRTPVYTPPSVRTPVYTPPSVLAPPVYRPVVEPERITPRERTQGSYKVLAKHMLELSLRANAARLARVYIRDPLVPPSRSTMLESTVYDAVKNYSLRILRTASVPFSYQTVTGETFVVENSAVRKMAINYMNSAMKLWGYYRGTVAIETPTVTPVYTPPSVRSPVYTPPSVRSPVYTPPSVRTPVYTPPSVRTPVYTPPSVRTPVYTPPSVLAPPVYRPVVEPERITPRQRTQGSYKVLAKHMLELSLRANAGRFTRTFIRQQDPLVQPPRPMILESGVYDAVKNYALRVLRTASVPFAYQTVTGETFVVEESSVRKMAINWMESAIRLWGYYRGTVAIETPTRTPVYMPPVTPFPIETPTWTPVYTPPVTPYPIEPTPVYTPPVIPEPTPVYTPPVELPVTPEATPIAYPTQESYKLLSKHALELSLRANAGILAQVNIRDPLTPPLRPMELPYTIYDAIKEYAKATIRTAVIPFGYKTVRGERFMVRNSGIRTSALKYMEKALRLWGYHRSAVTPEKFMPLPVVPEPVLIPEPLPVILEPLPVIPEPLPVILEPLPVIPELLPVTPEPTPVYISPVELPITPEVIMVEEGKAVQWAVSYTLSEQGYPLYSLSSETRIGVSQEVFNSLVNRAGYIADQMIEQNTYSPRL